MPTLIYFLLCHITLLETNKEKKQQFIMYNDNRKENEVKYH